MAEVSLSKLLLQSRGAEVIKKVQIANVFKMTEKEIPPVKITPVGGKLEDEEQEMAFKGNEKLAQVTWNVSQLWRWDSSELSDEGPLCPLLTAGPVTSSTPVKTTGLFHLLIETSVEREKARKEDMLEATLESIRSLMLCQRAELHLRGCISLWRIAAQRAQHKGVGDSVFTLLIKVLRSDDKYVAAIGAAAVWCLAEQDGTLRLWDYVGKALLFSRRFGAAATCVSWAERALDPEART